MAKGQPPSRRLTSRRPTHIPQVEGDLQAGPEVVRELGVHVQHLQQVVSVDLVQVAVGEGPHVPVGLPRARVQVQRLSEDVVLPWRPPRGGLSPGGGSGGSRHLSSRHCHPGQAPPLSLLMCCPAPASRARGAPAGPSPPSSQRTGAVWCPGGEGPGTHASHLL